MKQFLSLSFIILNLLSCSDCNNTEQDTTDSHIGTILKGEHDLYPIYKQKYLKIDINSNVYYMWDNQNQTCVSYIHFSKIRFEYNSDVNTPYIKYRWRSESLNHPLQYYIDNNVVYVLIVHNKTDISELFEYDNKVKDTLTFN